MALQAKGGKGRGGGGRLRETTSSASGNKWKQGGKKKRNTRKLTGVPEEGPAEHVYSTFFKNFSKFHSHPSHDAKPNEEGFGEAPAIILLRTRAEPQRGGEGGKGPSKRGLVETDK